MHNQEGVTPDELTKLLIEVDAPGSPSGPEVHITILGAIIACELGAIFYFILWGLA